MQDLTQNIVTGALSMGAPGSKPVSTEPLDSQSLTPATSFSEALGSAVSEEQSLSAEGQQTMDEFAKLDFSNPLLTDSGESFPLEGQEIPVISVSVLKPNQQLDETVSGLAAGSEYAVPLDLATVNEPILVNPGQILAQEKLNDVRTVSSTALNGIVQSGAQQQIRSQLNQLSTSAEKNADAMAPTITGSSLFDETLVAMPNAAKLVDGLLQAKGQADAKLVMNDLGLSTQSLAASRSGIGEQSPSLGAMNLQNVDESIELTEIKTPINAAQWKNELGEQVAWMAKNKIPAAEIKINPAHLGPIEIKISFNNEQATVSMIASQSATREALEAAMPRLRETFSDSGLQLGDADVSSQHPDSGQDEHQTNEFSDTMNGSSQDEPSNTTTDDILITPIDSKQNSGVDIFA